MGSDPAPFFANLFLAQKGDEWVKGQGKLGTINRGRGSTFKVVGPHNIVTKEAPPRLAPTGQENF